MPPVSVCRFTFLHVERSWLGFLQRASHRLAGPHGTSSFRSGPGAILHPGVEDLQPAGLGASAPVPTGSVVGGAAGAGAVVDAVVAGDAPPAAAAHEALPAAVIDAAAEAAVAAAKAVSAGGAAAAAADPNEAAAAGGSGLLGRLRLRRRHRRTRN